MVNLRSATAITPVRSTISVCRETEYDTTVVRLDDRHGGREALVFRCVNG
jgi:hypothetical protein